MQLLILTSPLYLLMTTIPLSLISWNFFSNNGSNYNYIDKVVHQLLNIKSSGPDKISALSITPVYTNSNFQSSLDPGMLSGDWKVTNIIPIIY